MTWDDDDKDRVTFTRRHLSAQEIEDNDFRAFLASSDEDDEDDELAGETETKDKTTGKSKKEVERKRLRSLLLGGDGGDGDFFNIHDDGKNKAADLEITFAPGLTSESKVGDGDEENMTTMDRYRKKMADKKQTRMSKWEKNKAAREEEEAKDKDEDDGPAISRDDFFEADSSEDEVAAGKKNGTSTSRPPPYAASAGELALLATDVTINGMESKHFDMAKVIKAEKEKTKKKSKKIRKKGKGAVEDEDDGEKEKETGEGFEIDVTDDRFKALHEQHEFALDPSNPQ